MNAQKGVEAQNWSHGWPSTLTIEAVSLKLAPWRVCRLGVADSEHSDEEQDQGIDNRIRIGDADPQPCLEYHIGLTILGDMFFARNWKKLV
jgi:hypothetical protein